MKLQGIGDTSQIARAEIDAYLELMRGDDRGRSFLQVMRSTETTIEKQALYRSAVHDVAYPVQVVWAVDDPALKVGDYGEKARAAAGLQTIRGLPGKHFFQEDQSPAIADCIAQFVSQSTYALAP